MYLTRNPVGDGAPLGCRPYVYDLLLAGKRSVTTAVFQGETV
jgi:hypothetical protein